VIKPAAPAYQPDDLLAGITAENQYSGQDFGGPLG
jgi:hypothetical protein